MCLSSRVYIDPCCPGLTTPLTYVAVEAPPGEARSLLHGPHDPTHLRCGRGPARWGPILASRASDPTHLRCGRGPARWGPILASRASRPHSPTLMSRPSQVRPDPCFMGLTTPLTCVAVEARSLLHGPHDPTHLRCGPGPDRWGLILASRASRPHWPALRSRPRQVRPDSCRMTWYRWPRSWNVASM